MLHLTDPMADPVVVVQEVALAEQDNLDKAMLVVVDQIQVVPTLVEVAVEPAVPAATVLVVTQVMVELEYRVR
jgi:hypothetical protein